MKKNIGPLLVMLKAALPPGRLQSSFQSVEKFFTVLTSESDRGLVLAGAAFIDNALEKLIKAYLVKLPSDKEQDEMFSFQGPVGTFSNRISMAFALGLIDSEIRRDIRLIKKIRNECAHTEEVISLEDHAIGQRIGELVCLGHFVDVLQASNIQFESLRDNFVDKKNNLLFNIAILLVYIADAEERLTRLAERQNHVAEWAAFDVKKS